jgi:N-acylneuraminate cytidylyltransferase
LIQKREMIVPDVLAVVPARGGSKGLPRKNILHLHGHPLLAYSIAAGKQAQGVTRTICSTDDPEIQQHAKAYGAEVPFLRPSSLAQDISPDLPLFLHVLQWFGEHENWKPEIIVHLRPTSPIRFPGQVDAAIQLLANNPEATSVRAVCPAPCTPYKMWRPGAQEHAVLSFMRPLLDLPGISEPFNHPRQELPVVWWQTGGLDVMWTSTILEGSMTGKNVLPLITDQNYAVDIDGNLGFQVAEALMQGLDCIRPESPRVSI